MTRQIDFLTADRLRRATGCSPATAAKFVEPLRIACRRYDIDTPARIAAFVAQLAHESARFDRLTENLNYSAHGMAATWPGRFRGPDGEPNAFARDLHRQPERIANVVYADRLGNGPPESGDGWRYRGRGLIQITGRSNYRACGAALGVDLETYPELLEYPLYAALSAGWYWHMRGLNAHADRVDVERITRLINGGTHGLADRVALTEKALTAMA
ncbi:glycoside hydrolase family 19 protein [Pseudazoarcus pumilus]|uniref:Glycoside hydrolase family 19 n=1 Tax=Pseudazoarcus pumilus TaxID=2067960 RepID=A0A2I6S814_9RHOO|nr:glycoside hydrolase family 19 protein [Pseudazoarcus pumilus]AUN95395.1 glycoside hydrolase family 19 [Pseudazoarcus pumilus]